MLTRLRDEERGFGLVELIIAMSVLNVALLALVASLNSGVLALDRASRSSTAASLADAQMELFRALRYTELRLDAAEYTGDADATYTGASFDDGDVVYDTDTDEESGPPVACADPPGTPRECDPSRVQRGPDGRNYRIDTYMTLGTPPNAADARPLKIVTVVVRDADDLARVFVRQQSTFDVSTG